MYDTPMRSGLHAKHILYNLTHDPRAFLSPHLIKCLLRLQPGFSVINDTERAALGRLIFFRNLKWLLGLFPVLLPVVYQQVVS